MVSGSRYTAGGLEDFILRTAGLRRTLADLATFAMSNPDQPPGLRPLITEAAIQYVAALRSLAVGTPPLSPADRHDVRLIPHPKETPMSKLDAACRRSLHRARAQRAERKLAERTLPNLVGLSDTVSVGFQDLAGTLEQFSEALGENNTLHLYLTDVYRAFGAATLAHSHLADSLRAARDGQPAPQPDWNQADALAALADLKQAALAEAAT